MKTRNQEKKKQLKKRSDTEPLPATSLSGFTRESLFSVIPDLVCTISPDGHIHNSNPAWEKILGYTESELPDPPYVAFLHPDDIPLTVTAIEKSIHGSRNIEFINRFRCKDGTYRWLHWMIKTTGVPQEIFVYAKDITRQRDAELLLEKKERTLTALQESSPYIFLSLDLSGKISGENNKLRDFTGFSEEETSGKSFTDFVSPEDKGKLAKFFLRLKHGEYKPVEIILIRKDSQQCPVLISGFVVPDPNGSSGALNLVIQDLSANHKILRAIQEKEKNLRGILETMKDAVLVLDNEGKILYSNSRFSGLWGIPGEMLGIGEEENLLGFVVKRLQELKIIHKKVSELGQKSNEEQDIIEFTDGRFFEIRVVTLVSGNDISERVVFMRDRTDEINRERVIALSEIKFRTLTELSQDLVFVARDGRIEYVNHRTESLTGYSRDEFYSMNTDELVITAPESRPVFEENLKSTISGHPVDPFEYVLIRKNGERIVTILMMTEINILSEKLIAFFISDINIYKQSEMIAARRIESVDSYHKLMVGRELKMIELKKEINKLLVLLGEKEKYKIVE